MGKNSWRTQYSRRVRSVFGSNEGWRHVDIDGWTDGRTDGGPAPEEKKGISPPVQIYLLCRSGHHYVGRLVMVSPFINSEVEASFALAAAAVQCTCQDAKGKILVLRKRLP